METAWRGSWRDSLDHQTVLSMNAATTGPEATHVTWLVLHSGVKLDGLLYLRIHVLSDPGSTRRYSNMVQRSPSAAQIQQHSRKHPVFKEWHHLIWEMAAKVSDRLNHYRSFSTVATRGIYVLMSISREDRGEFESWPGLVFQQQQCVASQWPLMLPNPMYLLPIR
jgi:hypothetical protein